MPQSEELNMLTCIWMDKIKSLQSDVWF